MARMTPDSPKACSPAVCSASGRLPETCFASPSPGMSKLLVNKGGGACGGNVLDGEDERREGSRLDDGRKGFPVLSACPYHWSGTKCAITATNKVTHSPGVTFAAHG